MTGTAPRPIPHRKNAVTLLALSAFVGVVYVYSITAVKQEDFSDVKPAKIVDPTK
eukprot:m.223738 g.223738  ORF g.223738 m.223738 type:complete len:55 (+) comp16312_c0_seq1:51-215(+)